MQKVKEGRRVAIVAGLRTPFQKQATGFRDVTARDLAASVVKELIAASGVAPKLIEKIIFGQVLPSIEAPNIAREAALLAGLPTEIDAFSVSRACATGYQAAASGAESIWTGQSDAIIVGGTDSSTDVPITVSKKLARALLQASKAKSLGARLAAFSPLKPSDLVPVPPAIAEISTGLTMGQSAEKMAKENGISREAQDAFAHRSHQRAALAEAHGKFSQEVMTVYPQPAFEAVKVDNLIRHKSDLNSYAQLRPAFDRAHGSVTAGNASPLTDGASALLLMSEERASAEGLTILGYIKAFAFSAIDPAEQLLMGPAYATPLALDRAGLGLEHMDLIDMHEAFAAQVLSNTQAFASQRFAEEKLGRNQAIGEVDWDRFNVLGGSIALGHPFAATGTRQINQTLRELIRRDGQYALCTACAAGGLGAAMVIERAADANMSSLGEAS